MPPLWKKLDTAQELPVFIAEDDEVFYAREYISKGGFGASEANQLIMNFKKPISRKGQNDWHYKIDAINRFARELAAAIRENAVLASIPSSKCMNDPEYDSRLDDALSTAHRLKSSLIIEKPITVDVTLQPSHSGGSRNPSEIYNHLVWKGFTQPRDHVLLIDDVLTTGAHFRACKKLIHEHLPNISVMGVFWAKTVWPMEVV